MSEPKPAVPQPASRGPRLTADSENLLRTLAPQVLGVLTRRYGDFDTAEDAVQEALLAAAAQWPGEGQPDNPRAWLIEVAKRRYIDTVRSESARRNRESATVIGAAGPATARPSGSEATLGDGPALRGRSTGGQEASDGYGVPGTPDDNRDDTLTLFFLCCHPALSPASAIALTLRAVGGLTTEEIARAFLLPESTMAQRISRAKKRLAGVERPFATPAEADDSGYAAEWRERVAAVLHVLYLIFTEGHTTSGAQLRRADLSVEAIRLARALHQLLPDDPEVTGLLALLLLNDSRRAARTGPRGELIPLAEQDRRLWDRKAITEGLQLVTATLPGGLNGPYQIQAAIAALHAHAVKPEDTQWNRILELYTRLERLAPNPMVTLNRAVALAMVEGPQAGLAVTADLAETLTGTHRLDAVRGHLFEMAGDTPAAIAAYTAAARRTTSTPERDYLTLRAARLREDHAAVTEAR
ncbi:sigma-70 family RNA polymerase sigma factor [Nocardia sp. 2]|uniref:Sigma-70 family RNA polymerase sigma factor n=1 Tax=Nocardia acididurans TaxID=2802282 RepID=A0ABS1MD70_9NOCA|nr:sigma-70 family RNA polymerase sigma factor [Nocardia acididurans]MBL1078597.1 sigma-70 family RNA polymerase sigma factor [Nocardia acididurans]